MSAGRDRAWIAAHLPHRDAMSLLDAVVDWDAERLHACAMSHRRADHPLRRAGVLPVTAAIEYGAQAVAAHGALLASAAQVPGAGYLASVRGVTFHVERLDEIEPPLDIVVERVGDGAGGVVYTFRVSAAGRPIAEGRVAIVLDAQVAA